LSRASIALTILLISPSGLWNAIALPQQIDIPTSPAISKAAVRRPFDLRL
jgi:hypothetical protein